MRWLVAVVLTLHGIAHLVGFAVSWQLLSSPEVPYKTTLAAGALNAGDAGMRVVGVLWLALALAFVGSAAATVMGRPAALPITFAAISGSLLLCAVSLPEARIGLAVNLILAVFLAIGPRAQLELYRIDPPSAPTQEVVR